MLADERRRRLLDAVSTKGSISVTELARRLGVSMETIRRDIIALDGQNLLRKTHGGALANDTIEPAFRERIVTNIDAKRAIGRAAAALVPDGASVILDFGTTALCVAESLAGHHRLVVFTSGLQAANRLAGRNQNTVHLLGGEVQPAEGTTLGRDATAMLARYHADFAFVGAGVVSPHPWLMDFSREAAELRALMLAGARTPVVLADHSKFDRFATHRVENFERAVYLVTDRAPKRATRRALATLAAEVLVAGDDPPRKPRPPVRS